MAATTLLTYGGGGGKCDSEVLRPPSTMNYVMNIGSSIVDLSNPLSHLTVSYYIVTINHQWKVNECRNSHKWMCDIRAAVSVKQNGTYFPDTPRTCV